MCVPSLYTDVILFFRSFFSKTLASPQERAWSARNCAEREKEKYLKSTWKVLEKFLNKKVNETFMNHGTLSF